LFSPRVLALVAIPVFVVLAVIAGLALRLWQDERAAQTWTDHTYQVIVSTQTLLADVQSAEVAERGYRVGGGAASVRRIEAELNAVPKEVAHFRALTSDNPQQQARAAALQTLLNDWSTLIVQGVNQPLPSSTTRPSAEDISRTIAARRLVAALLLKIDEIHNLLSAAANEEYRLLVVRTAGTQSLERSTLLTALLGALVVLAIIGVVVALLMRSNVQLGQSEAERGRQAKILQATLDSIRDGIAVFESDQTLAAFNPNFFRLAGLPVSLAEMGTPLERFRAYEAAREAKLFPPDLFAADSRRSGRQIVVANRNLEVYSTAVPNDGFLIAIADVTARVRSEEALRQAQKMEAIGHLTGGVAHDFNNLLQVVSANLDLAGADAETNPRLAGRLKNAANAVERGSRLTAQLLAFARRQALDPRAINPGRLVQEMTDMLRRALGELVEVESAIAGGLWNTFADPNQVQNAILNLAINGRDAMPSGGKLTIEVSNAFLDDDYAVQHAEVAAGQYVMIAVTDTGIGMAPDVMARAFEPFFTTKNEGQGTGLGLSQVYGFVKQSGGHVKIYSEVGEGTTIKMYLPRTRKAQEGAAMPADTPLQGGSETILAVEDDPDVRSAVTDMLADLGYNVIEAENAEQALEILREKRSIDLLFSDVVMPGSVSTREMARIARELCPEIKILFTSGYTQNAIVHNGRLDEDVFLLSKPYRKHDLARKLRTLLGDPKQSEKTMTQNPAAEGAVARTPRKALVVDDEVLVRMTTADMASEIGLTVVEANDGPEALDLLAKDAEIDVLVTDLGLPGMSGAELIRKAREARPSLSIVVVSGYSRDKTTEEQIPADAAYLSKPFDVAGLRRAIFKS
jgi:signal transduction histidine kinase/response regulator RpfG family c-di-GMP phosphodiesterase